MTLDVNKPENQVQVSELASYIRENRVVINTFEASVADFTITTLSVPAGTVTLVVGTDLANCNFEIVLISGIGASVIEHITGALSGHVKVFVFQDNDISLKDGTKVDGKFYLNQLPALSDFSSSQDDVLAVVNIGGDGSAEPGYWKELYRTLSVK